MDSFVDARQGVRLSGLEGQVQSVAGFASLHCAITLLLALMVQYTIRSKVAKIVVWVNFGLTVVATLYFGWHYIADDLAGVVIAMVSFYVGGLASGQKFEPKSLRSHPTTTTSAVPVCRTELELHRCSSQGDTPVTHGIFGKTVPHGANVT